MEARNLRRKNKSNANKTTMRKLDCQSIGHAKLKKFSPISFRDSMNEFMSRLGVDHFFADFFFALMSDSSSASSAVFKSLLSKRHCTIGVSAPLKACLSA